MPDLLKDRSGLAYCVRVEDDGCFAGAVPEWTLCADEMPPAGAKVLLLYPASGYKCGFPRVGIGWFNGKRIEDQDASHHHPLMPAPLAWRDLPEIPAELWKKVSPCAG